MRVSGTNDRIDQILKLMSKIGTILNDIDDKETAIASFTQVFPNIIFWLDPEGVIIDYFTLDQSLLYVEPKKFLNKKMNEVLPSDVAKGLKKALDDALGTKVTQAVEYKLDMVDKTKWFVAILVPLKNNTVFATVKDVTDMKVAQDAVPVERLLRQKLMETSPIAILLIDRSGVITVANPSAEALLGRPSDKLIGSSIFSPELALKDDKMTCISEDNSAAIRIIKNKETIRGTKRTFKRPDGERIEMQIDGAPLIDDKGEVQGAIGFLQDLTEKTMAEQQLREKSEFLQGILDNASEGIFVLDDNSNYVFINEECGRIVGLDPKDWIGKRAGMAIHPDDFEKVLTHFMRTTGNERSKFEARLQAAGGEYRTLDIKLSPLTWAGKRHVLGIVADITESKKAEALMREKARDEVYGFLASALPVFATSVPSHVRDTLVATFGNRFESHMRPRFENAIEEDLGDQGIPDDPLDHPDVLLRAFMRWTVAYFENLGVKVESIIEGTKGRMDLLRCPWIGEARGNPVFCLLCRAIISRTFSWTKLRGESVQLSSIGSGDRCCRFEFNYIDKGGAQE